MLRGGYPGGNKVAGIQERAKGERNRAILLTIISVNCAQSTKHLGRPEVRRSVLCKWIQ